MRNMGWNGAKTQRWGDDVTRDIGVAALQEDRAGSKAELGCVHAIRDILPPGNFADIYRRG